MVNVSHLMPPPEQWPGESDPEIWQDLLDRRYKRFHGFCQIEEGRGFVKPSVSLSSSEGQEIGKILLYRTLEEMAESHLGVDPFHWKEEVIDAMNYYLGFCLLDSDRFQDPTLDVLCHEIAIDPTSYNGREKVSLDELGLMTVWIGGELSDYFRNRAWMHNSQDQFFSGDEILTRVTKNVIARMLSTFSNFGEFWAFYIAKDEVLRFRLETKY